MRITQLSTAEFFTKSSVFLWLLCFICAVNAQQPSPTPKVLKPPLPLVQKQTVFVCGLGIEKLNSIQKKRAKKFTKLEKALLRQSVKQGKSNLPLNEIQEAEVTILVVYTPIVTRYLEGATTVERHVRDAEKQANTTFQNSAIPLRIRVIRIEEVAFPESHNFNLDLEKLAFGAEGRQIRLLRDQLKADQVALIVDEGDYAGLAFGLHPRWDVSGTPSPLDPSQFNFWAERAFFEIRDDCIDQSYKCFTHELGHNLGAGHDFEDWLRLFVDSHGHSFNPPNDTPNVGLVGTMMSYDGANNRILYFSNPEISYFGRVTGDRDHNNSRALVASMTMVSRYR